MDRFRPSLHTCAKEFGISTYYIRDTAELAAVAMKMLPEHVQAVIALGGRGAVCVFLWQAAFCKA